MGTLQPASAPEQTFFIYRLSSLGDIALVTGVLRFWHERCAHRFIVLTGQGMGALFWNHPAVDGVFELAPSDLDLANARATVSRLAALWRARQPGAPVPPLIDLHGTLRARLLSFYWPAKVYHYPKMALDRRCFLKLRSVGLSRKLRRYNVTQRYAMALIKKGATDAIPARRELLPCVFLDEEEKKQARERLAGLPHPNEERMALLQEDARRAVGQEPRAAAEAGSALSASLFEADSLPLLQSLIPLHAGDRPVLLHPYATHPRKAWPRGHWLALASFLDRASLPWLVVGKGQTMFPGHPWDLTGNTTLRELCALLACGSVLVTGDSGPMHLAAAVGTPVLALFGPTTAEWGFYPEGENYTVLEKHMECRPCSLHGSGTSRCGGECMREITPDETFQALLRMLGASAG